MPTVNEDSASPRNVLFRLSAICLLLGALTILAVGCGSSGDDTSSPSAEAPASTTAESTAAGLEAPTAMADISGKDVTLVSCTSQNPYCGAYNETLTEVLEGAGASVTVLENNYDATVEAQDMGQAISRAPDLIVTLPTDPVGIAINVRRAEEAGIPVIDVVGPLSPEGAEIAASSLLTNDEELGRIAARNLQTGLKEAGVDSGKIAAITGTASMLITKARMEGFEDELSKTPEYELVEVQDGNWDPVQTAQIAGSLFSKYASKGGLQGVYGMADYQASAIVPPAEQAGLNPGDPNGGLMITGSNCAPTGIEAIEEGTMYGGATQSPTTQASDHALWIAKFLSGEEIPKTVFDEHVALTKDNLAKYKAECMF